MRPLAARPARRELRRLAAVHRLLVCCDFDGTLSAIVPVPDDARPVPGAMGALSALGRPDTTSVLISGRTVADLRRAVRGRRRRHAGGLTRRGVQRWDSLTPVTPEQEALLGRLGTSFGSSTVRYRESGWRPSRSAWRCTCGRRARGLAEHVLAEVRSTGPGDWPACTCTEGKARHRAVGAAGGQGHARSSHCAERGGIDAVCSWATT